MLGYGTNETVHLRSAACPGVELAADRPREARPSCLVESSRGDRLECEQVERSFPTVDPWERVVDFVARPRR
jgi:hypothetical protein